MTQEKPFKYHPIQLHALKVIELAIKINFDKQQTEQPEGGLFRLYHGHSDFNEESREISVKIGAEIDESDDSPFTIKVELMGVFHIATEFPDKFIDKWASENAPLILYPYLREHVHSLTSKAGFSGTILPLFEIPSMKLEVKSDNT